MFPYLELKRTAAVAARVELGAVGERAHVVHLDGVARLWEVGAVADICIYARVTVSLIFYGCMYACACGCAYPALMVSISKPMMLVVSAALFDGVSCWRRRAICRRGEEDGEGVLLQAKECKSVTH
jgi:hypothetical protein